MKRESCETFANICQKLHSSVVGGWSSSRWCWSSTGWSSSSSSSWYCCCLMDQSLEQIEGCSCADNGQLGDFCHWHFHFIFDRVFINCYFHFLSIFLLSCHIEPPVVFIRSVKYTNLWRYTTIASEVNYETRKTVQIVYVPGQNDVLGNQKLSQLFVFSWQSLRIGRRKRFQVEYLVVKVP